MNYLEKFTSWLLSFVPYVLGKLYDKIIDLFQALFDLLMDFALTVVSWFPAAPSQTALGTAPSDSVWLKVITMVNWVFPLSYFINLITAVIAGVVAYFFIAPVARWFKLIT